jgi:hypothetical protein
LYLGRLRGDRGVAQRGGPAGVSEAAALGRSGRLRPLAPMSSLLELASAFAAECERVATISDLGRGVCALVEPFGYHGVASGRLGRGGGPDTFHFANWAPGWL